jgi:hypothetical protein
VNRNKNVEEDSVAQQLDWVIHDGENYCFSYEKFEDIIIPFKISEFQV